MKIDKGVIYTLKEMRKGNSVDIEEGYEALDTAIYILEKVFDIYEGFKRDDDSNLTVSERVLKRRKEQNNG